MEFKYKGINEEGKLVKGLIHSSDENELLDKLRLAKINNISYKKVEKQGLRLHKTLSGKALSNLARTMKNNLKAGIPITTSIELAKVQCPKHMREDMEIIKNEVHAGNSLYDAFKKVNSKFPELFMVMIRIGEESGKLDIVFGFLEVYYLKEYKRRKKLISVSIYPIFTLSLAFVLGLFVIAKILPKFFSVLNLDKDKMPFITRFYFGISMGLNKMGIFAVPIIIVVGIFIIYITKKLIKNENVQSLKYKLPGLKSFSRLKFECKFTLSMWMMCESGIDFKSSIEIFGKSEDKYISKSLSVCIDELARGSSIYNALKKPIIFSKYLLTNIYIGEVNGTLEEVLKTLNEVLEEETNIHMDRVMSLMEPVLMLAVGGFVLSIILAVLIPMMSMYSIKL